jgi:acyl carrier protein
MDRTTLRATLVDMLESDTGNNYQDLTEDARLREDLGLDSIDVVSVVSQIERRYRIRLTHEELEKLVKVGELLDLLEVKIANAPPRAAA